MWIGHGSDPKYQVRYELIHHTKIFNYIGPPSGGWLLPYDQMIDRANRIVEIHNKNHNNFFRNLQESVKREGFRNPIIVRAGFLPTPFWKNLSDEVKKPGMKNMAFCDQVGGSRLWTAFKLNMALPCIVKDYVNMFSSEPLTSPEEVLSCFGDAPEKIELNSDGLSIYWKNVRI